MRFSSSSSNVRQSVYSRGETMRVSIIFRFAVFTQKTSIRNTLFIVCFLFGNDTRITCIYFITYFGGGLFFARGQFSKLISLVAVDGGGQLAVHLCTHAHVRQIVFVNHFRSRPYTPAVANNDCR